MWWLVLSFGGFCARRTNLAKESTGKELGIEPILGGIGDSDGDFALVIKILDGFFKLDCME